MEAAGSFLWCVAQTGYTGETERNQMVDCDEPVCCSDEAIQWESCHADSVIKYFK